MGKLRRKFGMVFQYAALFDSMNVVENIAFPLIERYNLSRDEIMERVRDLLRRLDLANVDRHRAEDSARAVGRAAQARGPGARAHRPPEILLYDEPTTGLDPVATKNVDEMIRRTADEFGVTSVVISHDMASTFRIGDRISMLDHGQDRRHRHARRRCWSAGTRRCASSSRRRGWWRRSRAGRHEAQLGVAHRRRAGARRSSWLSYLLDAPGRRATATQDRAIAVWALFNDASGLFEKSRVQTAGISVGQIEKRELDQRNAQGQDHDPHRARHQAVRKRRRGEEVGVAAGRVLPGDRSTARRSKDGRRASSRRCAKLKDGDQIKVVTSRSRSAT